MLRAVKDEVSNIYAGGVLGLLGLAQPILEWGDHYLSWVRVLKLSLILHLWLLKCLYIICAIRILSGQGRVRALHKSVLSRFTSWLHFS